MKLDEVKRNIQKCEDEMRLMLINTNNELEIARIKSSGRYVEAYGNWKYFRGVEDAKEMRI